MPIGLAPTAKSGFASHLIDGDALDSAPLLPLPFNDGVFIRGYSAINQPNCQVIIEDFMPGQSFDWVFAHDEFQYCISGEMEVEVWLPPLYGESTKVHITPGTIYTYPLGARKRVTVLGDQPFRHICICPPSPDYPFPTLEDLKSGGQ
jgi:quercetin dioxygenase-like cupin family protein